MHAAEQTNRRKSRGYNYWRLIKSFFIFGSLLAIIIVTRIRTQYLYCRTCDVYVWTDNNKIRRKKPKNNQQRQGRLILFVPSSYYRYVCIANERILSNRYCAWFAQFVSPGEIDGQVNDLSSVLVSTLLQRRMKNYTRFDRKKRSWPACLAKIYSKYNCSCVFMYYIFIIRRHRTIIMEKNLQTSRFFYVIYI